jgi:hypothetical protein
MPRSRKRNRTPIPPPPKPPPKRDQQPFLRPRKIWSAILATCTLLGVAVLWPRVTVEPMQVEIDPLNPSPISFKISNTGFISLRNIQPFVGICDVVFGKPAPFGEKCNGPLEQYAEMKKWRANILARDETTEIRIDDLIREPPGGLGGIDISVGIEFNPWIVPYRWRVEYRFQTRLENDGKLSWTPRPLNQ